MGGRRTFTIDAFPASAFRHLERDALVCIDVISATSALVTAAARGARVVPASSPDDARRIAAGLGGGIVAIDAAPARRPREIPASPVVLMREVDGSRPVIVSAGAGTELLLNASPAPAVYAACFRNMAATARALAQRHDRIALIGAGEDGDFRCEDQMAAAQIGAHLMAAGFECENPATAGIVQRWADVDLDVATWGKSAAELKAEGRGSDVDFIVRHADDLDVALRYEHGALATVPVPRELRRHARTRVGALMPAVIVADPSAGRALPVH